MAIRICNRVIIPDIVGCNTTAGNTSLGINNFTSTAGYGNTAIGTCNLVANANGACNIAIGVSSLRFNSDGGQNIGIGNFSLYNNTTGFQNIAIGGCHALTGNTIGYRNTALGFCALFCNTVGYSNIALGSSALQYNLTGSVNIAIGSGSMFCNSNGCLNTAIGTDSLLCNTTGLCNVAIGQGSLRNSNSAGGNVSLGYNSGCAITTGSYNTIIGNDIGTNIATSSCNVVIADGAGNVKLFANSANNVGIGTFTPGSKLDVKSQIAVTNSSNVSIPSIKGSSFGYSTSYDAIVLGTTSGNQTVSISYDPSVNSSGAFTGNGSEIITRDGVKFIQPNGTTNWYLNTLVFSGGNVGVGTATPGYKLEVNGSFAATTKSFVINHPTKPGMRLRYGSLEGPENGIYIRGRLYDSDTIQLPDYWIKLIDPESITVNLTPIGSHQNLYVREFIDNQIVVGIDGLFKKTIDCYYTVFAERADVEKLQVEVF